MYYRYQPHPYYRRYYNIYPYYYRRYYNPYYNIIDSQIANIDQRIDNYGDMTDVIQDANIYQSMTPAPEENTNEFEIQVEVVEEIVEVAQETSEENNTLPPSPFISLQ